MTLPTTHPLAYHDLATPHTPTDFPPDHPVARWHAHLAAVRLAPPPPTDPQVAATRLANDALFRARARRLRAEHRAALVGTAR